MPKYEVENNINAIKGLIIKSNQFVLISSLVIFMLAYLSYLIWWKNFDLVLIETLTYSLILLPFLTLGTLRSATLRGLKYVVLGQLSDTLLRNFFLCFGIGICFFLEKKLTPPEAMLINVCSAIATYFISYLILRNKLLINIK